MAGKEDKPKPKPTPRPLPEDPALAQIVLRYSVGHDDHSLSMLYAPEHQISDFRQLRREFAARHAMVHVFKGPTHALALAASDWTFEDRMHEDRKVLEYDRFRVLREDAEFRTIIVRFLIGMEPHPWEPVRVKETDNFEKEQEEREG